MQQIKTPAQSVAAANGASSHSASLTSWADVSQGRLISEGDVVMAVGDVRLLTTSFQAPNGRLGLMATIEQSQFYGYFNNTLFIGHSVTEMKHNLLFAFALVLFVPRLRILTLFCGME